MKYLILITIAFILWLTAPIWMIDRTGCNTIILDEEDTSKKVCLTKKQQEQKEFIIKYGHKPRIDYNTDTPYVIKEYWETKYSNPEKIIALRCTPLEKSKKGWKTVCDFRVPQTNKGTELLQEIYYIKQGEVSK